MPRAVTSAFAGLHAHDDDEDQYYDHRVVIDYHDNGHRDTDHTHLHAISKSKVFLQQLWQCPWQQACLPSMHEQTT